MKTDIVNREDIIKIVDLFYAKVKQDDVLGYIFNEVANVNWDTHLVKMYDFWDSLIFRTGTYMGRPFPPHAQLNNIIPLTELHFNKWLILFHDAINELYIGNNTDELKLKSFQLKEMWNAKFDYINTHNE